MIAPAVALFHRTPELEVSPPAKISDVGRSTEYCADMMDNRFRTATRGAACDLGRGTPNPISNPSSQQINVLSAPEYEHDSTLFPPRSHIRGTSGPRVRGPTERTKPALPGEGGNR